MKKIRKISVLFSLALTMVIAPVVKGNLSSIYADDGNGVKVSSDSFEDSKKLPSGWSKFAKGGMEVSVGVVGAEDGNGDGNVVKMWVNSATDPSLSNAFPEALEGEIIVEQDIMVADDLATRFFLELHTVGAERHGESLYNFGNDGKITASGKTIMNYEPGQWYTIKTKMNTETGKYVVEVKNRESGENASAEATYGVKESSFLGFRNRIKGAKVGEDGTTCYIDNVNIYNKVLGSEEPEDTEMPVTTTAAIYMATGTVTVTDESEVTFADGKFIIPEGITSFTFRDDGVAMEAIFTDTKWRFKTSDTEVEPDPEDPEEDTDKIVVNKNIKFTKGIGSSQKNITSLEPGLISGQVTVKNQGNKMVNSTLIVAVYQEGKSQPIGVAYSTEKIKSLESITLNAGFNVPNDNEEYFMKILVWDDMENMNPLANSYIFNSNGMKKQ